MARPGAGLLHNREFVKLWTAKTGSDFGSLISGTALSFTAVLYLHATPAQLSLLMVANLLPKFIAGLVAGVWVDRLPRRPLMIAADIGRALLLATIPAAALMGELHIAQLYLVTLFTGLLTLLFDIADRSYLPTLVAPEELIEANSKLTATSSVAEFSAFSLGGWLVQWFTGPMAVLIDALSFVWSALFLGAIRAHEPPPAAGEEPPAMRRELIEGLTAVRDHPVLKAIGGSTLLINFSHGIFGTVVVAYMARDLGFKPGVLGMIWSIGGITSLLGALQAERLTRRFGIGRTLAAGLLCAAIGGLLTALAHGATWLSGCLLVLTQIISDPGHTVYNINEVSLRQSVTPERLHGRVNATLEFIGLGATLLGALLGGLLGQKYGLRSTLFIGTLGTFAAALLLALSPIRHIKTLRTHGIADADTSRQLAIKL